jgi:hypothetical protein
MSSRCDFCGAPLTLKGETISQWKFRKELQDITINNSLSPEDKFLRDFQENRLKALYENSLLSPEEKRRQELREKPLRDLAKKQFADIVERSQQQQPDNKCFIATACQADTETLNTFYELRDRILISSQIGRKFVKLYYQYAPSIASIIQSHEQLQKSILRGFLKPLAATLRNTILIRKKEKVF